jgi:hypothetical protein
MAACVCATASRKFAADPSEITSGTPDDVEKLADARTWNLAHVAGDELLRLELAMVGSWSVVRRQQGRADWHENSEVPAEIGGQAAAWSCLRRMMV